MSYFKKALLKTSIFAILLTLLSQLVIVPVYVFVGLIVCASMLNGQFLAYRDGFTSVKIMKDEAMDTAGTVMLSLAGFTLLLCLANENYKFDQVIFKLLPVMYYYVIICVVTIFWAEAVKKSFWTVSLAKGNKMSYFKKAVFLSALPTLALVLINLKITVPFYVFAIILVGAPAINGQFLGLSNNKATYGEMIKEALVVYLYISLILAVVLFLIHLVIVNVTPATSVIWFLYMTIGYTIVCIVTLTLNLVTKFTKGAR